MVSAILQRRDKTANIILLFCFIFLQTFAVTAYAEEAPDPFEPVNRGIFWVNDKLDVYLLEPVASGYDTVMPNAAQDSVGNFFSNLLFPVYFVSDVLQLKFDQAAKHTARFFLNTTVGVGGLFDVAEKYGLPPHHEDIGLALAYWGVPSGPYIVIPLLGPSNLRDLIGRSADNVLNPTNYIMLSGNNSWEHELVYGTAPSILNGIQTRANLLEAIQSGKEMSLDYYSFAKRSYEQSRDGQLYDGNPPDEYDEEFEDEFEEEE